MIVMLVKCRDGNSLSIPSYFLVDLFDYCVPSCVGEAQGVKKWEDAMDEEMRALLKNET